MVSSGTEKIAFLKTGEKVMTEILEKWGKVETLTNKSHNNRLKFKIFGVCNICLW